MQGTIDFVSGKGWFFARCADESCVFIPQRAVENRRYLKVDDRVEFTVIPSTKHSGEFEATNVKYLGHTVARQVGEKAVANE